MKVGSLKQKASWRLVTFVFTCTFTIIILLIMLQKSTDIGLNLSYENGYSSYYNE